MARISAGLKRFEGANILRVPQLHRDELQQYWQTLYMHDLLKYRLCDVKDPTWTDAENLIGSHGQYMYYTQWRGQLVSEFTLEPVAGRAALVHFSFLPTLSPRDKVLLGATLVKLVLVDFNICDTLLGLTPECNQAAIKLAFASGFKFITRIPSGQCFDGEVVDAVLTQVTVGDFHGRRR